MNILEAVILGIIQGITEWLPVSSSGHLVIAQQLFGLSQPLIFDIMLHLGSLAVVVVFFWRELKDLILGALKFEKEHLKTVFFIVAATIPIALVGFLLGDYVAKAFTSILVVGIGLIFTSIILFLSKYPKKKDKRLTLIGSAIIGIFQAIAILPGVSRSGSTISSGMMQGIKKEDVARFSFIIFIPAILGATIIEIPNIGSVENIGAMIIGTLVSAIVGFFSLKLLMNVIRKNLFFWFGAYCFIIGSIVIITALV